MEKLREEILQSQSVRTDLLKWKLALIGKTPCYRSISSENPTEFDLFLYLRSRESSQVIAR